MYPEPYNWAEVYVSIPKLVAPLFQAKHQLCQFLVPCIKHKLKLQCTEVAVVPVEVFYLLK